jgi:phage FluMu protein Com
MIPKEDRPMDDQPPTDPVAAQMLDGNALAGSLAAAFGGDMTAVPGRCSHCGAVHMVAELRAYVRAPGAVLRCPSCDGVVLRIVETDAATYVDARGAAYLRFDREARHGR